jgi:hypothetical protein
MTGSAGRRWLGEVPGESAGAFAPAARGSAPEPEQRLAAGPAAELPGSLDDEPAAAEGGRSALGVR